MLAFSRSVGIKNRLGASLNAGYVLGVLLVDRYTQHYWNPLSRIENKAIKIKGRVDLGALEK